MEGWYGGTEVDVPRAQKARNPRRTLGALLVAGLALAIGTPISLHANQGDARGSVQMVIPRPYTCAWHTQTFHFNSKSDFTTFQAWANPKGYRFLGPPQVSNGPIVIRALHWECP